MNEENFKPPTKEERENFNQKIKTVEDSQQGYELRLLDKEVKDLKTLKEIIGHYFPDLWEDLKGSLSNTAITSLKNMNGCPVLVKVGNPSGMKTTTDSLFYGHPETHLSDDFTPKAFVSHASNVKKEELESIDLLPKLKNKTLITPELAPLFEAPKEKLVENFSMLTRVLDGEGLHRDSGVQGHRGYSGDYCFAWQGSTTPIRPHIWNMMGKLGNRMLFWNMHEKNNSEEDYIKMFSETEYSEKVKICRSAVHEFLNNFFKNYPKRKLEWKTRENEKNILIKIIRYAQLLAKLRGSLTAWKSKEEGVDYEYTIPVIEEPMRAINSLRNLARGHALINDRLWLEQSDLKIVKWVCLSSMPYDRMRFFQLLQQHEGRLTTEILQKELICSDETARKTMKTFEILGVVKVKTLPIGSGRPMFYVEINPEFEDLIKDTQGSNDLEKDNPSNIGGVSNDNTQGIDGLEYNKPSENNPVSSKKDLIKQQAELLGMTPEELEKELTNDK